MYPGRGAGLSPSPLALSSGALLLMGQVGQQREETLRDLSFKVLPVPWDLWGKVYERPEGKVARKRKQRGEKGREGDGWAPPEGPQMEGHPRPFSVEEISPPGSQREAGSPGRLCEEAAMGSPRGSAAAPRA